MITKMDAAGRRPRAVRPAERPRLGGWIALTLAAALAACASRAEGDLVYLKQHQASVALTQALLAAEVENPAAIELLYYNEAALNKACAPLQEAAYLSLNDKPVDRGLKMRAYGALDTCAARTREIEDLLWRIDPQTAGHYLDRPLVSVRAKE